MKTSIKKLLAVGMAVSVMLGLCGCRSTDYKDAVALMEEGSYAEAAEKFSELGDYKDSAKLAKETGDAAAYQEAKASMDAGDFEQAAALYEGLGDYRDSAELLASAREEIRQRDLAAAYEQAEQLAADGEFLAAREAYLALEDYCDSETLAEQMRLNAVDKATRLLAGEDPEAGRALLEELTPSLSESELQYIRQCAALASATVGEDVLFGSYEQDGDPSNGAEDLVWLVLDVKDGKALLITKYAIACRPYEETLRPVNWAGSDLRNWLNGEFLQSAFSAELQRAIELSELTSYEDYQGTKSGKTSKEALFLLDPTEAERYFRLESDKQCLLTISAAEDKENWEEGAWRLRSVEALTEYAPVMLATGKPALTVNTCKTGVRPAMWVSLSGQAEKSIAGAEFKLQVPLVPGYVADELAEREPGAPSPEIIVGMNILVEPPQPQEWLAKPKVRYVDVPIRAYLRYVPAGEDFDLYVNKGEKVVVYALRDAYSFLIAPDGRYGWVTTACLW